MKVTLLIGSNIGNKDKNLKTAIEYIEKQIGALYRMSSVYQTEPWGFSHSDDFLNMVIVVESFFSPHEILENINKIEKEMGRIKTNKSNYESRIIDIDILFYGDHYICRSDLVIPHPLISKRMFALAPLEEIIPDYIHPILNKSIKQLKEECTDLLKVELWLLNAYIKN